MILYSQFNLAFQGISRAILLYKIKIKLMEMFELNERMPGMSSDNPAKIFYNFT